MSTVVLPVKTGMDFFFRKESTLVIVLAADIAVTGIVKGIYSNSGRKEQQQLKIRIIKGLYLLAERYG